MIDDTSVCFINCHLAAGQRHVRQRNADAAAIVEAQTLPVVESDERVVAFVNGGDGMAVLDHEMIFVGALCFMSLNVTFLCGLQMNGDMNYCID